MGKENQVNLNIKFDPASPMRFLKRKVLNKTNLQEPLLFIRWTNRRKNYAVDSQPTKEKK